MTSIDLGRPAAALMMLAGILPGSALGQGPGSDSSAVRTIDTVIVVTEDVFPPQEVRKGLHRVMNALHAITKPWVVRNELLLKSGDPFDSFRLAETERRLRDLNIFARVTLDTATIDDQLALVASTRDGWTLSPKFSLASAGGTVTGTIGVSEGNFLGMANQLRVFFNKEVDRSGWEFNAHVNRFVRTPIGLDGSFRALSDGNFGNWQVGVPFRAFPNAWSVEIAGEAGDERVLQFRQENDVPLDTTTFRRRSFINRVSAGVALTRSSQGYVRVGANVEHRREEFVLRDVADQSIPDSTFTVFGLYVKAARAKFFKGQFWQGFGQDEDIDVSTKVELTAWVAPKGLGYERTGIGPEFYFEWGSTHSRGYYGGGIDATALITGAGLDSGRIDIGFTAATKFSERHVEFIHVRWGRQKNPPPGEEWDLGFNFGPRTFGPHAFVGTHNFWGTFEHRWYGSNTFLGGILGLGLAAFVDYGGAWYTDQDRRLGGNAGVGILFGSPLATKAAVGRLEVGLGFGDRPPGARLAIAFGGGFDFFTGQVGGRSVAR